MEKVRSILKEHYNVDITNIMPQQGGWATLAYRVFDKNKSYFLKVYEKNRSSTPKLTALIEEYVPIMVWLERNSYLQGKISVPFLTDSREYKCEDEQCLYLLYDYIEGETIGHQDLTENQVQQLVEIITELHSFGEYIPVGTDAIKEDFDVPFLQSLKHVLHKRNNSLPFDVLELINTHIQQINGLMHTVEKLSQRLKKSDLRMVLCHTDLHNWNLMQSGQQLILIDWEGLKLAPAEADLMFLIDKPYYNEFLNIYEKMHKNFEINPYALQFYQGRRRLEDIWEFMEQLLYDEQDESERILAMNYLREELNKINKKGRA